MTSCPIGASESIYVCHFSPFRACRFVRGVTGTVPDFVVSLYFELAPPRRRALVDDVDDDDDEDDDEDDGDDDDVPVRTIFTHTQKKKTIRKFCGPNGAGRPEQLCRSNARSRNGLNTSENKEDFTEKLVKNVY